MKILFASIGAYGHLYPLMPLALAAAEAGHDVRLATGEPFLTRMPLPTVPAYTGLPLEEAVAETRRRYPELTGVDLSIAMFADIAPEQMTPTLIEVCESFEPDLVVYEGDVTGAGIAADLLDIPAAAFAIGLSRFVYPMLHGATLRYRAARMGATWPTGAAGPGAGPSPDRSGPAVVRTVHRGTGDPDPLGGLQRGDVGPAGRVAAAR